MDNNWVIYVCLISEMCTVTLRCSEVGPMPDVLGLAAQKCVGSYCIYQWWLLIQLRLIQCCICGYQYKENTICVDEELGHISEVPNIIRHFRSLIFRHPHFGRPSQGWSDPTCIQVVCYTIDPLYWSTTTQKRPLSCPASLWNQEALVLLQLSTSSWYFAFLCSWGSSMWSSLGTCSLMGWTTPPIR